MISGVNDARHEHRVAYVVVVVDLDVLVMLVVEVVEHVICSAGVRPNEV